MRGPVSYLGCCAKTDLVSVKTFLASQGETIGVWRCVSCGSHWFGHIREYEIPTDEYNRRIWCVRLQPGEVTRLLEQAAPPDASCFSDRAGVVKDEEGVCHITGVPYFLQQAP